MIVFIVLKKISAIICGINNYCSIAVDEMLLILIGY
jgi:hypothetical protein